MLCRISACRPPAMPAIAPDSTKESTLMRVVGTAIAAAARGLSREASITRPARGAQTLYDDDRGDEHTEAEVVERALVGEVEAFPQDRPVDRRRDDRGEVG